jgi:hypothetical protein
MNNYSFKMIDSTAQAIEECRELSGLKGMIDPWPTN